MAAEPYFSSVAVLGLGTMGHGIAQVMAIAGCSVKAFDDVTEARASSLDRIQANLEQLSSVGLVDDAEIPAILSRIEVCATEADAVDGAQFVTEAIREDLELKRAVFSRLEKYVSESSILVSNTSSYPMTEIAKRMEHPERALVTHWFNPPHIVPVVEVVPGENTNREITDTAYEFLGQLGKVPVRLEKEVPGFLVNRVQIAMFREVWDLVENGVATAGEIDRAIRGSMGMRLAAIGPLAIMDYAGWDVCAKVYQNLIPDLRADQALPEFVQQLIEAGHFGAKTGQGVFRYTEKARDEQIADRDRLYLELVKMLHAGHQKSDRKGPQE